MRLRLVSAVVTLVLVALSAGAQSPAAGGEKKEIIANGGVRSSLLAAPVIGQPYSARWCTRRTGSWRMGRRSLKKGTTLRRGIRRGA